MYVSACFRVPAHVVRLRTPSDMQQFTSHKASNAEQIGSAVLCLLDLLQSHFDVQ